MVGVGLQSVVKAQLNAGKRYTQVKIQRSPDLDQLVIQFLSLQRTFEVVGHVKNQWNRGNEFIGAVATGGFSRGRVARCKRRHLGDFASFLINLPAGPHGDAHADQWNAQHQKHERRHAWNKAHAKRNTAADDQRARLGHDLGPNVLANVRRAFVRLHTGHDDARADRDEQRRNLRDQTVSDGKDRVGLHGLARGHSPLQHADQNAAQQIDGHDNQAGNGIPFYEFHGAVHGAVELAFLFHRAASSLGLIHVNGAGTHVAVNCHLLTGHGVERKPRSHFRHAFRALGNHHKLYDGEDQKHHQTDNQIATHHKIPEGVDDAAGVPLEQDQAGGGDRDAEAKKRGDQQHGWKR